jgi:hypothetical protein
LSATDKKVLIPAFPDEPQFDLVAAAFTTRAAGGESNDMHAEAGKRAMISDALTRFDADVDPAHFTAAKQVHGGNVSLVGEAELGRGARSHDEAIPSTDALITRLVGVPLGIFTADCTPIFLYDPETPAVGLVHAGWRGTAKSILRKTVEKMRGEFGSRPEDVWASVGPSIGPCCYEVGADVFDEFAEEFDYAESLFKKTSRDKWHLDLRLANRLQLEGCGVAGERIIESGICSACRVDEFHSARKDGPRAGRTLSLIAIRPGLR